MPMILNYELDLFYDTLILCDYSKIKGLKVNPWRVINSHYVSDPLPKVYDLIPPIVINDPTGNKERTCKNTFISSIYQTLERINEKNVFILFYFLI